MFPATDSSAVNAIYMSLACKIYFIETHCNFDFVDLQNSKYRMSSLQLQSRLCYNTSRMCSAFDFILYFNLFKNCFFYYTNWKFIKFEFVVACQIIWLKCLFRIIPFSLLKNFLLLGSWHFLWFYAYAYKKYNTKNMCRPSVR